MVVILALFIGLISAFVGSIAGLGGGIFIVPILLFLHKTSDSFAWATPQTAVGVSLVVMIFIGFSSTMTYLKNKRVDLKSGLIFSVGSVPGAVLGAWLSQYIKEDLFTLLFGILMLVVSAMFFIRKHASSEKQIKNKGITRSFTVGDTHYTYSFSALLGVSLAFGVGVASGLFGIGGGSLMVPAMILIFGFPPHIATATSMFMIFISSILSSSTHIMLGHVEWTFTLLFIPGAILGGILGAKTNQVMRSHVIELILRILLVIIAFRLIWEGLH